MLLALYLIVTYHFFCKINKWCLLFVGVFLEEKDWVTQWVVGVLCSVLFTPHVVDSFLQCCQVLQVFFMLVVVCSSSFVHLQFLYQFERLGCLWVSATLFDIGNSFKSFSLFSIMLSFDQIIFQLFMSSVSWLGSFWHFWNMLFWWLTSIYCRLNIQ